MLCSSCSTLSILHAQKNCFKCQSIIYSNLYIVCDNCSTKDQICNICLKKTTPIKNKNYFGGCRCGSK